MSLWAVVITKPAAEEIAESSLRRAGYRVYLPRYRKLLSPHGADRKPASAMRPLFVGYLFAEDWRGWPRETINGVSGLMPAAGALGAYATMSDPDITAIREREYAGEYDEIGYAGRKGPTIREDVKLGDAVGVDVGGTMLRAIVQGLSADGRALVEAMVFGRVTRLRVGQDVLRVGARISA